MAKQEFSKLRLRVRFSHPARSLYKVGLFSLDSLYRIELFCIKELYKIWWSCNKLNNNSLDKSNFSISRSLPKSYVTLFQPTSYTRSFQGIPPSPTLGVLSPVRPGLWSRLTFFPDCSYIIETPGGHYNKKEEAPRIPRYLFFRKLLADQV
jgi:hypothetical protein